MRELLQKLNVTTNPVFRRYAVTALRPAPLLIGILVTQILAACSWALTFLMVNLVRQPEGEVGNLDALWDMSQSDLGIASVSAWIPILILQFFLSYLGGTAKVALGVANDTQWGMTDSFRLTPLSSSEKLVGQLLGLPLFTSILSLLLLPWAILSVLVGGVSWEPFFRVYLLFLTGALMHHALGLTTATLIRQKILAGTLSQFSTVALHLMLPGVSGFGIGVFGYLSFPGAVGADFASLLGWDADFLPTSRIRFFHQTVSAAGYHWTVTLLVLLFLLLASYRRWANADSQLFGKLGTVLFTVFLFIFSCGELVPMLDSELRGDLLLTTLVSESELSYEQAQEGEGALSRLSLGSYASGFGICVLILAGIMTPSRQARQRFESLGKRLPPWDDSRPSWLWIAGVALLGAVAWAYLAVGVSKQLDSEFSLSLATFLRLTCAFLTIAFLSYTFLLCYGWKPFFLAVFLFGVVPLMISPIVFLVTSLTDITQAILGLSLLWLPLSAIGESQVFFYLSLTLHLVILALLIFKIRQREKTAFR